MVKRKKRKSGVPRIGSQEATAGRNMKGEIPMWLTPVEKSARLVLKAKRVYVKPSVKRKGYYRLDPRTKHEATKVAGKKERLAIIEAATKAHEAALSVADKKLEVARKHYEATGDYSRLKAAKTRHISAYAEADKKLGADLAVSEAKNVVPSESVGKWIKNAYGGRTMTLLSPDGTPFKVELWYNNTRDWVTMLEDVGGNQIGPSIYTHQRDSAKRDANEMIESVKQGKLPFAFDSTVPDSVVEHLHDDRYEKRKLEMERIFGTKPRPRLVLKAKKVYVHPTPKRRGYYRLDPRTKHQEYMFTKPTVPGAKATAEKMVRLAPDLTKEQQAAAKKQIEAGTKRELQHAPGARKVPKEVRKVAKRQLTLFLHKKKKPIPWLVPKKGSLPKKPTTPEPKALFIRDIDYKDIESLKDPNARDRFKQFLQANDAIIVKIAQSHIMQMYGTVPDRFMQADVLDDIKEAGYYGLWQGIKTIKPSKKATPYTYLVRLVSRNLWHLFAPHLAKKRGAIEVVQGKAKKKGQLAPKKHLIPVDEQSLEAVTTTDPEGKPIAFGETLESEQAARIARTAMEKLSMDEVFKQIGTMLTPMERKLLTTMRKEVGTTGQQPVKQKMAKILKITPGRVSQLLTGMAAKRKQHPQEFAEFLASKEGQERLGQALAKALRGAMGEEKEPVTKKVFELAKAYVLDGVGLMLKAFEAGAMDLVKAKRVWVGQSHRAKGYYREDRRTRKREKMPVRTLGPAPDPVAHFSWAVADEVIREMPGTVGREKDLYEHLRWNMNRWVKGGLALESGLAKQYATTLARGYLSQLSKKTLGNHVAV